MRTPGVLPDSKPRRGGVPPRILGRAPRNVHPSCRTRTELTKLIAATPYKEVRAPLELYKYRFVQTMSEPLGNLLIRTLTPILEHCYQERPRFKDSLVVVPIPLHHRRELWRGFNHVNLLANYLSKHFDIPSVPALKRTRNTKPQVELVGTERKENMRDVFAAKEHVVLRGKVVLLLDDVYTTGATMNEAAKVLRTSGAREVWGVVLAH